MRSTKITPEFTTHCEIYKVTNILNGKSFIGNTWNQVIFTSYIKRQDEFSINNSENNIHNRMRYLNDDIKRFGNNAFTCEVVKKCSFSNMNNEEIIAIKFFNTVYPNGYNTSIWGSAYEVTNSNEINTNREINGLIGEIYIITNNINGMNFIGQKVSHKKFNSNIESINYGKYLISAHKSRFKEHILSKSPREFRQDSILVDQALNIFGERNFTCNKITDCLIQNIDVMEALFIDKYDSRHPNGYNINSQSPDGSSLIPEQDSGDAHPTRSMLAIATLTQSSKVIERKDINIGHVAETESEEIPKFHTPKYDIENLRNSFHSGCYLTSYFSSTSGERDEATNISPDSRTDVSKDPSVDWRLICMFRMLSIKFNKWFSCIKITKTI